MGKIEALVRIQKLIQNLRNETSLLETSTKELLNSINKNEFIDSQINQDTTTSLIAINQIQEECRKTYLTFMECEVFPRTITEVQDALNDKEKEMAFVRKYKMALETFSSFYSEEEQCEAMLDEEKRKIDIGELYGMTEAEADVRFKKYIDFIEAYYSHSDEQLDLVKYVQKLTPYFEAELITAVVFNKNISMVTKLTNSSEHEGEGSIEDESDSDDPVEVEEHITEIYEPDDSAEDEVTEIDLKISENIDLLSILCKLLDKEYSVSASDSKNEKKPFGVKVFKSDINGVFGKLRVGILRNLYKYDCATCELLQIKIDEDSEAIERECDYLINKGYVKKYVTEAWPALYYLTERGLKAFFSKESAAYLQLRSSKKKDEIEVNNAISYVCCLLKTVALAHATKKANKEKEKTNVACCESITGNSFILQNTSENGRCDTYITILDSDLELIEEYMEMFKNCLEQKKGMNTRIFILGYNIKHIQNISNLLNEHIAEDEINIYELLNNSWSETAIDDKEVDNDISENNEANTSAETEDVFELELLLNQTDDEQKKIEDPSTRNIKNEDEEDNRTSLFQELSIGSNLHVNSTEEKPSKDIEEITAAYQRMINSDKIYCATSYLKAAALSDAKVIPLYKKLAYAVNDPLESCSYSSDILISLFFDESTVLNDCMTISAVLRNYFSNHIRFDYSMQQLQSMIKKNTILDVNTVLNEVVYNLFEFKNKVHIGMDRYADYRAKDKVVWEEKLRMTVNEAKGYYEAYILGQIVERGSHKRFIETQKLVFSKDGDIAQYLKVVVDSDTSLLEEEKEFLRETFIKTETQIDKVNIDTDKIDAFIDLNWEIAGESMMVAHKTSNLMGSFRTNLFKRIQKIVNVLCDWIVLMESSSIEENDEGFARYKKMKTPLLSKVEETINTLYLELNKTHDLEQITGYKVLTYTLDELKRKLFGDYSELEQKYFYSDFMKNSKVLLDSDYLPNVADKVHGLDEFSPMELIDAHSVETELSFDEHLQKIIGGDDDCGTARLIMEYFKAVGNTGLNIADDESLNELLNSAQATARLRKEGFIENLELAQSYGQIDNTIEDKKDKILQTVNEWYDKCNQSGNFGFFYKILDEFQYKIKEDAKVRGESMKIELHDYCSGYAGEIDEARLDKIRQMIELQNYTVAEDLINQLNNDEDDSPIELLENDFLQHFIDSYDYNYSSVNDAGKMVSRLLATNSRAMKDTKGGKRLVENWLSNGGRLGEEKLTMLLSTMGFSIGSVQEQKRISEKIETYAVLMKRQENGRKSNYKHPISAFGSSAEEYGFRVVCLYGKFDADSLLDIFKEIGNTKNTLILLDYHLSISERRRLARKIKTKMVENIFAVLDRVVLMFLINNYSETSINRMLMSVIMPYSYYQPYVVDSAKIMPPEIFIGRKEELSKIESPSGVNIVYGGRQLGKSALLRMAKNDINYDENGDRAVLVDIKHLDYREAAKKIAATLSDEGVFEHEVVTDDWDELARQIKKRLRASDNKIPYLLLLLDEADAFIESCEADGFRPFDALKDIQSIGAGRFKFVVAGLRNIVRFKRNIALGNNSVLTHLSAITVKPFNVSEARELLEIPLFYLGLRFPKEKESLVSLILANTNYFPGLLQLYCVKLIEAMQKGDYAGYNETDTPPYNVQEKHIKKVLSDSDFQKDIRNKYMITLKVGGDDYYYVLALVIAYLYHTKEIRSGFLPEDIVEVAQEFAVAKILELSKDKIVALLEEMKELNVLRATVCGKYLFTRYSFFQMMGTKDEIEDDIMNSYMEE